MTSLARSRRTIARWEAASSVPDEQYQLLLATAYARTPLGTVALGPGSDFAELLAALMRMGVSPEQIAELQTTVGAAVADAGMGMLTFLGEELAAAVSAPESVELDVVERLGAASDAVNAQIGGVPFVRLHVAQAAIVDARRRLLSSAQPDAVRERLHQVAAEVYALAARLAFETHDDAAALALYDEAVDAIGDADLSRRALVRSSQTMVAYYVTGDVDRARRIIDSAVLDARRGESVLMRARAHALQAEMAARGDAPQRRKAQAALHLAWHDLDGDADGDPMRGVFSRGRLRGFEGICGIFLGEAAAAEAQLGRSAASLTSTRERVQRAIVINDQALAMVRTGAAEAAAERLHACVDLTAAVRGRVPAQRLRQTRLELRLWRREAFVAELEDRKSVV